MTNIPPLSKKHPLIPDQTEPPQKRVTLERGPDQTLLIMQRVAKHDFTRKFFYKLMKHVKQPKLITLQAIERLVTTGYQEQIKARVRGVLSYAVMKKFPSVIEFFAYAFQVNEESGTILVEDHVRDILCQMIRKDYSSDGIFVFIHEQSHVPFDKAQPALMSLSKLGLFIDQMNYEQVFLALLDIKTDQMEDITRNVLRLVNKTQNTDTDETQKLIPLLADFKEDERRDLVDCIYTSFATEPKPSLLIRYFRRVPSHKERLQIIGWVKSSYDIEDAPLLDFLTRLSTVEKRQNFLAKLSRFLDIKSLYGPVFSILEQIDQAPLETDWKVILTDTMPLCQKMTSDYSQDLTRIYKCHAKLIHLAVQLGDRRQEVMDVLKNLDKKLLENFMLRLDVHQVILDLNSDKIALVLKLAPYWGSNYYRYAARFFNKIDTQKCLEIFEASEKMIFNLPDWDFPLDPVLIRQVKKKVGAFDRLSNHNLWYMFFEIYKKISPERWDDFDLFLSLMHTKSDTVKTHADFFISLGDPCQKIFGTLMLNKKLVSVDDKILLADKVADHPKILEILRHDLFSGLYGEFLPDVPKGKLGTYIRLADMLQLETYSHIYSDVLDIADLLPIEDLDEEILNGLRRLKDVERPLRLFFNYIPQDLLKKYLTSLKDIKNLNYMDRFSFILALKNKGLFNQDELTAYWMDRLQHHPDPKWVKILAQFIVDNTVVLKITEMDELYQQALRTLILINNLNDPLTPYVLFNTLVEKRKSPVLWQDLKPKTEIVGNKRVFFNLDFLRTQLTPYVIYFKDVPKFSKSFLKDRLTALKPYLTNEILNGLYQNYGIERDFFDLDKKFEQRQRLENLLQTTGSPNQKINFVTARFMAIAAYIDSFDDTPKETGEMPERTKRFFNMICQVQNCPSGQSEGINIYYLSMPQKFKLSTTDLVENKNLGYLRAKAEVIGLLVQEIEKLFSGQDALMKDIVGLKEKDHVSQSSHQAGYLRNMIGPNLGLSSDLVFDQHTNLLYVHLVNATKQELMQKFFDHFSPKTFTQRIARAYYEDEDEDAVMALIKMGVLGIDERLLI